MNEAGRAPRVLIVTRNFPPYWGGMEKLNWHMADALAAVAQVRLVGPRGAAARAPAAVGVSEVPLKPLPVFLLCALARTLANAWRWKPDVVVAGSGVTAPLAWVAARLTRARAVVYVHGLDVAVRHWLYRGVWVPILRRMDRVIANSRVSAELAERLGVPTERQLVVYPGTECGDSVCADVRDTGIREELGLGRGPVLLSVGRLTERKGLREFVIDVLPRIAAEFPDCVLLVVGDAPTHSLYAKSQTRESIQNAADQAGVGRNIKFLGVIADQQKLARIYRAADLHVFPVRFLPGDPEGFGMVAIEAASFGVPTVAYATGGTVESVGVGASGTLVPAGDAAAFAAAAIESLTTLNASARQRAMDYAATFAWPHFDIRFRSAVLDAFEQRR